jgi:hypothetical protein
LAIWSPRRKISPPWEMPTNCRAVIEGVVGEGKSVMWLIL